MPAKNWHKLVERKTPYFFTYHNGRTRRLHRTIMEQKIGRPLKRHEQIHHIDGNTFNNDPANLMIVSCGYHTSLRTLFTKDKISLMKWMRHLGFTYPQIGGMFNCHRVTAWIYVNDHERSALCLKN